MKKIKILVADDNEINRDLIKVMLKAYPFELSYASNGLEAIRFFETSPPPDLVLMDLNMPVLNGFEALYTIKKKHPDIPVIAVTALHSRYDEEQAISAGFDEYLEKPLEKIKLVQLILTFCETSKHII